MSRKSIDKDNKSVHQEITDILDFLGRQRNDGDVRGDHLTKVLSHLALYKSGDYKNTLSKLTLICGIHKRYIQENYLDGLEAFGILRVLQKGNIKTWEWIGLNE